jgi:ELWxxDGT repeat protein
VSSGTFGSRSVAVLISSVLAILVAGVPAAAGDPPAMVKDINVRPAGSYPQAVADVDGTAYFFACDGSHNLALFTTDGSEGGTTAVRSVGACDLPDWDPAYRGQDDQPEVIDAAVGNKLFFAPQSIFAQDLWVSDGTPGGTFILNEDVTLRWINSLTDVGGTLYFLANSTSGDGLWTSDGTPEGTHVVRPSGSETQLAQVGSTLYFTRGTDLLTTDGTPLGTVLVKRIQGACSNTELTNLVTTGSRLYFVACSPGGSERQLWTSNGTGAGTHRVKDINSSGTDKVGNLVTVGAALYFTGRDATHGEELWQSNGTSAGTAMVRDISLHGNSKPRALLAVGARLSFTADDGTNGRRLYASDGTFAGTKAIKMVVPTEQVAVGSELFFRTASTDLLWKSDGTNVGTQPLADINATGDAAPENLANALGRLFVSADDGVHGRELWTTNGGAPSMLLDTNAATLASNPIPMAKLNGNLIFSADDGVHGRQLWSTDGTGLGTSLVKDVAPESFAKVGVTLYFTAIHDNTSFDLWKSDGTPVGTTIVKTISGDSYPEDESAQILVGLGSKVYFTTHTNGGYAGPGALWVSDGTPTGTTPLKTWAHGSPRELTRVGTKLLLAAVTYTSNCNIDCDTWHLWKSDGTATGTVQVSPTNVSGLSNLTAVGSTAFFTDGGGLDIWKSDGTASGTKIVKTLPNGDPGAQNLTDVAGTLFFTSNRYDPDAFEEEVPQLWVSNGTSAGTKVLHEFSGPRGPGQLTPVGSALYFAADDRTDTCCGYQLWTSDGTVDGTDVVSAKSFGPTRYPSHYPENNNPSAITNIDGTLWFAAQSDASNLGIELWKSDLTDLGTVKVADLDAGGGSIPSHFFKLGSALLFSADDGLHGAELWSLPLP